MRTLDVGYFANDDVTDWLIELEGATNVAILEDAFTRVMQEKWDLVPSVYSIAIAAAWVVMVLSGQTVDDLPEEVTAFVKCIGKTPRPGLVASALQAIERINAKSDLQQLTDGGTRAAAWHQTVADLESGLRKLAQQCPPSSEGNRKI
jgi:hypothetical protein